MKFDFDSFRGKNKNVTWLLSVLVVVIAVGLLMPDFQGSSHNHEHSGSDNNGSARTVPTIHVDSYGNAFSQSYEEITGKEYVLLEFFTLSCPHCEKSIPALNELNGRDDISVIAYVSDSSKKVREYAQKYGVQYTISRASEEYFKFFKPYAVPMSFLVDTKTLEVKKRYIGEVKVEQILNEIVKR